jgi:hypothetical protein
MLQGIYYPSVGEIQVKLIRISIIVAMITLTFLCIGFAAALTQDEGSTHVFFVPQTAQPGQTVSATIFFTSTSSDELQITYLGLHFDWMASDQFYGYNFSSTPITVPVGGDPHMFNPINIQIPADATIGVHTYTIGIDGTQGSSATPFSWSSTPATITVTGVNGETSGPTPTSTNPGATPSAGQPDLLLFGVIGAVVVIVVILVLVLVMQKKRSQPKPAANEGSTQPETPSTPPKSNPEQDFNI